MKVLWKNILKGNKEIYNLKTDPRETNNISSTNLELVEEFKQIIRKGHRSQKLGWFRIVELEYIKVAKYL
jgi:hypothetical protein